MQKEQNIPTLQEFDPNQTINLNVKTNSKKRQSKRSNINRINLSQKIDLKNHPTPQKQKVSKKHSKKQTSANIKLEHNQEKKQVINSAGTQPTNSQEKQPTSSHMQQVTTNSHDIFQVTPPLQTFAKVSAPQIYTKNFNDIRTKLPKIEFSQTYEPVKVNPTQKIQLGPKTQRSIAPTQSIIENPKKYKNRVLNSDFTSMRYQCFCTRQYLSYCATYHHLKKDHIDFLKQNRRFSFTNVLETTDPVYGFRIKKIMRQRLKCPKNENKQQIEKLGKQTKEKIKAQSPQIQKLLKELKGIQEERDQQVQMLKLFERKLLKAGDLVSQYQKMIHSFQQVFNILNIRQITQKLNNGPTVFQQNEANDQDYFPQ